MTHDEQVAERDRFVRRIRFFFPRAKWRDIDFMLWNMTAWPICGNDEAIVQLADIYAACGSDKKRGWWRKVMRMHRLMDSEMLRLCGEVQALTKRLEEAG